MFSGRAPSSSPAPMTGLAVSGIRWPGADQTRRWGRGMVGGRWRSKFGGFFHLFSVFHSGNFFASFILGIGFSTVCFSHGVCAGATIYINITKDHKNGGPRIDLDDSLRSAGRGFTLGS